MSTCCIQCTSFSLELFYLLQLEFFVQTADSPIHVHILLRLCATHTLRWFFNHVQQHIAVIPVCIYEQLQSRPYGARFHITYCSSNSHINWSNWYVSAYVLQLLMVVQTAHTLHILIFKLFTLLWVIYQSSPAWKSLALCFSDLFCCFFKNTQTRHFCYSSHFSWIQVKWWKTLSSMRLTSLTLWAQNLLKYVLVGTSALPRSSIQLTGVDWSQ